MNSKKINILSGELSELEIKFARYRFKILNKGIDANRNVLSKNTHGEYTTRLIGILGELAVASKFNIYPRSIFQSNWSNNIYDFKLGNFNFEVKSIDGAYSNRKTLMINKRSVEIHQTVPDFYILVRIHLGPYTKSDDVTEFLNLDYANFDILGWITACEVHQDKNDSDSENFLLTRLKPHLKESAYCVNKDTLNEFTSKDLLDIATVKVGRTL